MTDFDLTPTASSLPPAPPPSKLSDPAFLFVGADGLRAFWGILIYLFLVIGLTVALLFGAAKIEHRQIAPAKQPTAKAPAPGAVPVTLQEPAKAIPDEALEFLAVLIATFALAKIERRPYSRFGLGGNHRFPQFFQGLLWGLVFLSLLIALLYFTASLHFDARLLSNGPALRYGLIWALCFLLVGFFEETFFRGYLQYTLARGLAGIYGAIFKTRHRHALGFWTAALLLSVLFGATHTTNPGESPLGLLSVVLAGLFFSIVLYRTGSLWWAIGFHASWDWSQSFLYGVADSGLMVRGHLYATHPSGQTFLSGGLTGPEGSVLLIPVLALASVVAIFTVPRTQIPGEGLTHPDAPSQPKLVL